MSATANSAASLKPSLSGVRIKARKGAVKASAKHEPTIFRDQLYKYLETVPEGDFEGYANKLIIAGTTLELLKYSDALFEALFVGALLQPGGTYLDDGAPPSPFSVNNASEPPKVEELKKYVEVFTRVIRRYKYLQKPLDEQSLPALLQYSTKWPAPQREKIAITTGLLISQGFAGAGCLQPLTKDGLVKDDLSLNVVTAIFRIIIGEQGIDGLASHLKKGGVRDLLLFFPPTRRDIQHLEAHFKAAGLPQVVDWYVKRQQAVIKEGVTAHLKEMVEENETPEAMVEYIKTSQAEFPLPEAELVQCIWNALMSTVDWSVARPDQVESMALKEVKRIAAVLAPFCTGGKTQVALINIVQVYCYEDTKIIKTFPHILKTLYNEDCVSDTAIIYWHQKGAKPQGKQHFLTATASLVKYLQEQEDSDEEED